MSVCKPCTKGGYPDRPSDRRRQDDDEEEEESEYESDDSGGFVGDGDPDDQERQHYLDVCWSFLDYPRECKYDMGRLKESMESLDPKDAAICSTHRDRMKWIAEMAKCVAINTKFLNQMPTVDVCATDLGAGGPQIVAQFPDGHRVASRNSSKVRSTLRQFVRDWAVEGEAERANSYQPIIDALMKYLPPTNQGGKTSGGKQASRSMKVLCPGSGLGRLPFELVKRGYAAQGNEFSYHMLLGSYLILNRCPAQFCHVIHPFILGTTHRLRRDDHLKSIKIPDVCPCQVLSPSAELSMAAGEFIQVYAGQSKTWDAVASCFFLDTAKNIFLYIRMIADIIRPGGFFINLGPLLYHYAEMHNEISIELSWEEVRPEICKYFKIVEERRHVAQYTTNPNSLMAVKYTGVFFVAQRNDVPASGKSNPVFS